MRYLRHFLTFAIIALMMIGTIDAGAKTRRVKKNRKNHTTDKIIPSNFTTQEVLELYKLSYSYLSEQCPLKCADGVMLESVSFKGKCVDMVMSYTSDYMQEYGEGLEGLDLTFIAERAVKMLAVGFINDLKIPVETFAKTGIYYKFIIKDDKGNVMGRTKMTNCDVVRSYKNSLSGGTKAENNNFDLGFFKQMVAKLNKKMPLDYGGGVVMNSIAMEGTEICYDMLINNSDFAGVLISDPAMVESVIKPQLLKSLNETCKGDGLLDNMIRLGITFKVRLYAQSHSSPACTILFTSKDIDNIK